MVGWLVVDNWLVVCWVCYIWVFSFVEDFARVDCWLFCNNSVVHWLVVGWLMVDNWLMVDGWMVVSIMDVIVISHTVLRLRVVGTRVVAVL